MSEINYLCPQCRETLASIHVGDFDTWECKAGHGIGVTLTEAYGHFQEDEIHGIWKAARTAPKSSLQSPLSGQAMVAVTVVVDDDEIEGNQGPGAHPVTLDVAPEEQFLWFHVADFRSMPADLPNPPPSAEDAARLEQLKAQSIAAAARDEAAKDGPLEKLGYRFGSRAAALLHATGLMKRLADKARESIE